MGAFGATRRGTGYTIDFVLGADGTAGQSLTTDGAHNVVFAGPHLPLAGGTLTGALTASYSGAYGSGAADVLIIDTKEAGYGDFGLLLSRFPGQGNAAGTRGDNVLGYGYNVQGSPTYVAGDDSLGFNVENSYYTGTGVRQGELYVFCASGDGVLSRRPFRIEPAYDLHSVLANFAVETLQIGKLEANPIFTFQNTSDVDGKLIIGQKGYIQWDGTGDADGDLITGMLGTAGSVGRLHPSKRIVSICGNDDANAGDVKIIFGLTAGDQGIRRLASNSHYQMNLGGWRDVVLNAASAAAELDIQGGTQDIRIGDVDGNRYSIKRSSGNGYLDFTATQSVFSGYSFSTANKTNVLYLENSGQISIGAAPGGASSAVIAEKAVASIADNAATTVFTVTIPNAAHSASIRVRLIGSSGAGGAIGAKESTQEAQYLINITRTAGVNAVAAIGAVISQPAAVTVAGGNAVAVSATLGAITGAVGASNTFAIQITIARAGGSATNHTCLALAELLNAAATGVTVS